MGESFTFMSSPLKASKIIADGDLNLGSYKVMASEVQTDELSEKTTGHSITANQPIIGSGTTLELDSLKVNKIMAKDPGGATVVPAVAAGTTYTLFEKATEITSEAEIANGGVVALITVPDWVPTGGVITLTADVKNDDAATQYCYIKVLEVATFPEIGDILPYAGYIAAVQNASLHVYVTKTVNVTVGTVRKWAILIHSEAGITGISYIKNLKLSCNITSSSVSGGVGLFEGCT